MMILAGLILVAIFLAIGVFFVLSVDSLLGKLDFTSDRRAVKAVAAILKDRKGDFYDLGSARGGFAVKIAKALPQARVWGVDDNTFRTACAKIRSSFVPNANFIKADIFTTDISRANAAYIYLPQDLMPALQNKLQKELPSGAIAITNKVSFPNWQPIRTINQLYIYAKE